jgi:hypothetical protein
MAANRIDIRDSVDIMIKQAAQAFDNRSYGRAESIT